MPEIEETKKMYKQLCTKYIKLSMKINPNYYYLKSLETEILEYETKLRELGVDF